jgi:cellulose biosynthesis protein BcsQ
MPEDSAKDIQLLFSRAGMGGAKYREFPRHDPGAVAAAVNLSAEVTPLASAKPGSPSVNQASAPATSVTAVLSVPPIPETSAAPYPACAFSSYASLERMFAGRAKSSEAEQAVRSGLRLAVLSLAGGVGKTTLAATLARILSGMRKQVIVADCGFYPSVAHHLGSQGQRLGPLQFFFSPSQSAPMPIAVFKMSPGHLSTEDFQGLVEQVDGGETMMLMDIPTLQGATPGDVLPYASHVLVPVTPDMHSVAGVTHLQATLAESAEASRWPAVCYVINRFDESRRLHREIRSRLQDLLGSSLLPIVIREDEAIEEAAAQGMTVVDAFPQSSAVHEFVALAEWSCALSATPLKQRKEGIA